MDFIRRDKVILSQNYGIPTKEDGCWEFSYDYHIYFYKHRKYDDVDESLSIKGIPPSGIEGSFDGVIYSVAGELKIKSIARVGINPAFDSRVDFDSALNNFSSLKSDVKEEIFRCLSSGAENLLRRGVEYYRSGKSG